MSGKSFGIALLAYIIVAILIIFYALPLVGRSTGILLLIFLGIMSFVGYFVGASGEIATTVWSAISKPFSQTEFRVDIEKKIVIFKTKNGYFAETYLLLIPISPTSEYRGDEDVVRVRTLVETVSQMIASWKPYMCILQIKVPVPASVWEKIRELFSRLTEVEAIPTEALSSGFQRITLSRYRLLANRLAEKLRSYLSWYRLTESVGEFVQVCVIQSDVHPIVEEAVAQVLQRKGEVITLLQPYQAYNSIREPLREEFIRILNWRKVGFHYQFSPSGIRLSLIHI